VSLFAQAPPPESFHLGELTKVDSYADVPSYEYTIFNGADDAFTGATTVAIRVRQGTQVRYRILNGSIYIIDDDGKIQQTSYIRQAEVVRVMISDEDLRKLTDKARSGQPVQSEIPQVLDPPKSVTAPPSASKPDAKKTEPKKKAKPQSSN